MMFANVQHNIKQIAMHYDLDRVENRWAGCKKTLSLVASILYLATGGASVSCKLHIFKYGRRSVGISQLIFFSMIYFTLLLT